MKVSKMDKKKSEENKNSGNSQSRPGIAFGMKLGKRKSDSHESSKEQKTNSKDDDKDKSRKQSSAISLVMNQTAKKKEAAKNQALLKKPVAAVFNEDSDSEEEVMPKEAKMRMRNIGRETPTSAGPNSFNKGKAGFVNNTKTWEQSTKPRNHLEKKPDA